MYIDIFNIKHYNYVMQEPFKDILKINENIVK